MASGAVGTALASTNEGTKQVSWNRNIPITDGNVAVNVFYHEKLHQDKKKEDNTFWGHATEIYLPQIQHSSFKKIPPLMQRGFIGSYVNHMLNALVKQNKEQGDLAIQMIAFNKLNTGYSLSLSSKSGTNSKDIIIDITDNKTNATYEVKYKYIENKHVYKKQSMHLYHLFITYNKLFATITFIGRYFEAK